MKSFKFFCKELNNLQDIKNYGDPYNIVCTTGFIALYGSCFEQALRTIKEILETQGYSEESFASPKKVLQTAYKAGIIENEELWFNALTSRNNIANAFDEKVALNILNEIKNIYVNMFKNLKFTIEKDWL